MRHGHLGRYRRGRPMRSTPQAASPGSQASASIHARMAYMLVDFVHCLTPLTWAGLPPDNLLLGGSYLLRVHMLPHVRCNYLASEYFWHLLFHHRPRLMHAYIPHPAAHAYRRPAHRPVEQVRTSMVVAPTPRQTVALDSGISSEIGSPGTTVTGTVIGTETGVRSEGGCSWRCAPCAQLWPMVLTRALAYHHSAIVRGQTQPSSADCLRVAGL